MEDPPEIETDVPADRTCDELRAMIPDDPNKPYDIKEVIRTVADENYFYELHEQFCPQYCNRFYSNGWQDHRCHCQSARALGRLFGYSCL